MKKALFTGIALLTTCFAEAATYDYSYAFPGGTLVTGTLEGDPNGSFVDNVHNVTVNFDGTPMSGIVYTVKYDGPPSGGGTFSPGPVVSFDAGLNDFFFVNSDYANGDFAWTEEFYMVNPPVYSSQTGAVFNGGATSVSGSISPASWSLQLASTPTPDTGSTLQLFAGLFAFLGAVSRKRRG